MIKNLIVFCSPDWEVSYRTSMFRVMAKQLDKTGGNFIGINRPIYVFTDLLFNRERFSKIFIKNIQKESNILIYRPILFTHPILFTFWGNKLQKKLLNNEIFNIVKKEGLKLQETAYWISHPYQMLEVDIPEEVFVVYERYDKYDAIGNLTKDQKYKIKSLETKILARANLIIVTAQNLLDDIKQYEDRIIHLSNSADFEYFSRCKTDETLVNEKLKNIMHPVIGYLGTIHEGTDLELIKMAATALPGNTFLLIGPIQDKKIFTSESYKSLKGLTNVLFTGWLGWDVLPSYLKAFDIGIIPYRVNNEFNQYVDPNKYHEYMAMGLPIVSTRIPGIEKYLEWVEIADSGDEFINKIQICCKKICPDDHKARVCCAREDGWAKRVDAIFAKIHNI